MWRNKSNSVPRVRIEHAVIAFTNEKQKLSNYEVQYKSLNIYLWSFIINFYILFNHFFLRNILSVSFILFYFDVIFRSCEVDRIIYKHFRWYKFLWFRSLLLLIIRNTCRYGFFIFIVIIKKLIYLNYKIYGRNFIIYWVQKIMCKLTQFSSIVASRNRHLPSILRNPNGNSICRFAVLCIMYSRNIFQVAYST